LQTPGRFLVGHSVHIGQQQRNLFCHTYLPLNASQAKRQPIFALGNRAHQVGNRSFAGCLIK
jgi:hypothetical protein